MFERWMSLRAFTPVCEESIYVLCSGGFATGGPELLHQLVSALVERGRRAFIVYTPTNRAWETPAEYRRYGCPVATHVPDRPEVAVLVPEVSTHLLFDFRYARKIVWWLSVDYYRGSIARGWLRLYVRRFFRPDMPQPRNITHLCQSAYARDFVCARFSVNGSMLSDHLAEEYLDAPMLGPRRRQVAYNPKKGLWFTQRLISACPDVNFVALQNMSRDEMRQSLAGCSVYIDFGNHPGKDRIPREAAMCGAVVVVGKLGSARNFEDVPLDDLYKLSSHPSSIPKLIKLLHNIFDDFGYHFERQASYRVAIAGERQLFEEQLEQVFGNIVLSDVHGD